MKIGEIRSKIMGLFGVSKTAESSLADQQEEQEVDSAATFDAGQQESIPVVISSPEVVDVAEILEGPINGRVPRPDDTEISVEVKVNAPASAKVSVKVDVSQTISTTVKAQPRSRYVARGGSLDFWAKSHGEGIKLSRETKYHAVNMNKPLALGANALNAIELHLNDDFELQRYAAYFDAVEAREAGISPTEEQVRLYYDLRRLCDQANIEYNRRDVPETGREYQMAIKALRRLLCAHRRMDAIESKIIPVTMISFDSSGRTVTHSGPYQRAMRRT